MDLGLVLGISSLIATAIIGGLSFYLTHKTSTAAARDAANVARVIAETQIAANAAGKIAEFRVGWIDEFRKEVSDLVRVRNGIFLERRRFSRSSDEKKETSLYKLERLNLKSAMLRSRLLLRLKLDSDDEEEVELAKLLGKGPASDLSLASVERKRIIRLSRSLLKKEWDKVKNEIRCLTLEK